MGEDYGIKALAEAVALKRHEIAAHAEVVNACNDEIERQMKLRETSVLSMARRQIELNEAEAALARLRGRDVPAEDGDA